MTDKSAAVPDEAKVSSIAKNLDRPLRDMGQIIWLMSRSPMHKHLFLADIEWLILPSLSLGQYQLWNNGKHPTGFASWAYLGDEAEERIEKQGIRRLQPTDWRTGDNLWLIDFVAPLGGREEMLKELRVGTHSSRPMKMLHVATDGKRGTVTW